MATLPCSRQFLEMTRPILEAGDLELFVQNLERQWPNTLLCELLFVDCPDATKVALFSLSLAGKMADCPAISCMLRHHDEYISKLAEHALWSIWLRGDKPGADLRLRQVVQLIARDRLNEAKLRLDAIIHEYPEFAEAYNQRATVHFLQTHYDRAREDLNETLRLNPVHFAAIAGLGHCYAAEGRCDDAWDQYERALRIHPRAEGLPEFIAELQRCRPCRRNSSSPPPHTPAWVLRTDGSLLPRQPQSGKQDPFR